MSSLTNIATFDIRFPTSTMLDGSDAMNPDPDYSAAYLRLGTDSGDAGHGFVFTIGRGNDVQLAAVRAVADQLAGEEVEPLLADMGGTWRRLVHDSQLRWLGPEKGVLHMAIGAVVNALWDLKAKRADKPLWLLLSEMSPRELVDLVDFRYLTDALTPDQALEILEAAVRGREERRRLLEERGYPAYTTTPGWLGYDDEKLVRLAKEAVEEGFEQIKLKVGSDLDEDVRRLRLAREAVGPDIRIAVDANQRWDVDQAITWTSELAPFDLAWLEEPTSPDDVLGHARIAREVAPVPVATGEHMANRVIAKQ
jgi:L-fuconate dehydratase